MTEWLGRGRQDEPVHLVELAGTGKPGETAGAVATVQPGAAQAGTHLPARTGVAHPRHDQA
ncbi:hypothetical protein [Streptomyces sp. UG1]|uniref:hypothetical protein n=1 Tax=Streptomyces sp. UG1 TaxID=3417652 RepID=UPI003CF1B805